MNRRLDRNLLSGAVPGNLNNLSIVQTLYVNLFFPWFVCVLASKISIGTSLYRHLENNKLTGPLPNLTSMDSLNYVYVSRLNYVLNDQRTLVVTMYMVMQGLEQ